MSKFGISVALLTPFTAEGDVDAARLGSHANAVLTGGASGITLFGTTGEGASLSAEERIEGVATLLKADIPAGKLTLGIYANSVAEAAGQIRAGLAAGVTTFLVPPPFYFPGTNDEGLFAWYAQLLAATDPGAQLILYHIPQVTAVPLSADLVGRIYAAFPGRIRAVKDSSGSWDTATAFLGLNSVPVLVGDERLLHRTVPLGGAGSITGCANLHPGRLTRVFETGQEDAALSTEIGAIVACPVIPALKVLLARATGDSAWENLRAPLVPLSDDQRATLLAATSAELIDG